MHKNGKFKLAVQSGQVGYYAEVAMEIEIEEGTGLFISYANAIDPSWILAAGFGIAYARERLAINTIINKRLK